MDQKVSALPARVHGRAGVIPVRNQLVVDLMLAGSDLVPDLTRQDSLLEPPSESLPPVPAVDQPRVHPCHPDPDCPS
jgi:hypothetical protein